MGATFSRLKNWTTEVLSDTDLNAEIDNILNNLGPAGVDDYSSNATQMKIQTTPGALGSESLATSLAGEIERLRFVIKRAIGTDVDYWYEAPPTTLTDLVSVLGSGLPQNRISSGKTTGNSSQLNVLIPSGTTASLTLTASSVDPFSYYIAGTQYSITASLTLTGLTLANAANSTVVVNKPDMTGSPQYAKSLGQYGTEIYVDGMNSGPSALVGQIASFQATAGGTTEYFLAYIDSTSSLTQAWRGCFFNQSSAEVPPVAFNDNDNLLLTKLAWLFANTNSSLAVTYNNPTVSGAQPVSPAIGDYWFDLATTAWKTYNGTSWNAANATLIGMSVQSSAACVAARTFDSYKATSSLQSLKLERISNIAVQAQSMFGKVNVFGKSIEFGTTRPKWDITSNLKSGLTEAASTQYYLYLDENGSAMMTDRAPMVRSDLDGLYYPTETWRCVGSVLNDSSTHMVVPARTFKELVSDKTFLSNPAAYRTGSITQSSGTSQLTYPNNFANAYILDSYSETISINGTANSVLLNTLSLTPGVWGLSAYIRTRSLSGASSSQQVFGGFSTDSGTAWTASYGVFNGYFDINIPVVLNDLTTAFENAVIPFIPAVITTPTVVYLRGRGGENEGAKSAAVTSRMFAYRLDRLVSDE